MGHCTKYEHRQGMVDCICSPVKNLTFKIKTIEGLSYNERKDKYLQFCRFRNSRSTLQIILKSSKIKQYKKEAKSVKEIRSKLSRISIKNTTLMAIS